MPTFHYQAMDRTGKIYKGQMEAAQMREVAAKLRDDGLYTLRLQVKTATRARFAKEMHFVAPQSGSRVKLRDLLAFTRQFAVMIKAGVNLVNCLNLLSQQTENQILAKTIVAVRNSVEGGETLHVALSQFPKAFPPIYVHMVEAGEAGGQLETVLERTCEYLEREFEIRKKVSGALVYPAVIVCVATIVVSILLIFVIPQFLSLFSDAHIQLPLVTRILIAATDILRNYWYLLFGGLAGLVIGFRYYRQTPAGRKKIDQIFYRMPVIGPVIQRLATARFCRTLSTLLESGVMITNCLELVEKVVGNAVISSAIANARQNVTKGTSLAKPLEETGVFPGMVTQMIAVGEETGELPLLLGQVADFYEKEANYALSSITAMIEPAIIVCLGCVVAIIVSAIMLPMFDISSGATLNK